MLASIRGGKDPLASRSVERGAIALGDLAKQFLSDHIEQKRKPKTVQLYRLAINRHIIPMLGSTKAARITRADALRLHSSLRSTPVLANRVLAVLGSLYAWAGKTGHVPEEFNPAARVERNREQGRERYLTTAEFERLGNALRSAETTGLPWVVDTTSPMARHLAKEENRHTVISPHAVAAIRLLIFTGCRLGEILHLRWSDVDFERGMLHLADSKTGRKSVVLNAPALAVLDAIPRVGDYVIAGQAKKGGAEKPRSDLKKPWSAIRRHAGLGGLRIHDLRHSFASVGAGAGLGLPIVGKLLGHSQASTTQKYAHLDNDPLRRASNAIGATIAAAMERREQRGQSASLPNTSKGQTTDSDPDAWP
jgi:integrase